MLTGQYLFHSGAFRKVLIQLKLRMLYCKIYKKVLYGWGRIIASTVLMV